MEWLAEALQRGHGDLAKCLGGEARRADLEEKVFSRQPQVLEAVGRCGGTRRFGDLAWASPGVSCLMLFAVGLTGGRPVASRTDLRSSRFRIASRSLLGITSRV